MQQSLAERSVDVAFAFEGRQVSRNVLDEVGDNGAVLTFEVDLVYKGAVMDTVSVLTHAQGSACGVDYGRLGRVGVAVYEWRGEPSVSLCGSLVTAEELELVFGEGALPEPSPVGSSSESPTVAILVAAGIGVVIVLFGAAISVKLLGRNSA